MAGHSEGRLQRNQHPTEPFFQVRGGSRHFLVPCRQQMQKHLIHGSATVKRPQFQKPQVPPKPAHLQDNGYFSLPPSRPLPASLLLKPEGTTCITRWAQEEAEPFQSVGVLIKKFESSRVLIKEVFRGDHFHLPLSMDTAQELSGDASSKQQVSSGTPAEVELSNFGLLKVEEISTDDLKRSGDSYSTSCNTSRTEAPCESSDNQEQNSSSKIPNRDSGIDSPSCHTDGEPFNEDEKRENVPDNEVKIEEEERKVITGNATPVDNKRDSTQDEEDSDLDEGSSEEHEAVDSLKEEQLETLKCSVPQKLFNIASELLQTEEAYVKRLNLLDQVFCTKLTEAGIQTDVINGIFSNISSIYRFHEQFLLPELKTRITAEWNENPRIGDILQKLAPFLKMYGEYVKNFDRAMDLVNTHTQRSSQFKSVVHSIQKQDVCGNLTLQHHMLEPVQRIPRYELLLKDYLKKLPEDAADRKDAEKSLELIATAANHSNAAIRKMEKMHRLLEVYERLGGEEDIVNPANELIKEGHLLKLSAKNGSAQDRYLFLFNNMLLYCVPKLRLRGQKFSVRDKIDVAGMQVQENIKHNLPHTFTIVGKQRSLELQARTEEEKKDWIQEIQSTIEKHKQNSETFNKAFSTSFSRDDEHIPDSPNVSGSFSLDQAEGSNTVAGVDSWRKHSRIKKEKEKQTCKSCNESFNSITKRRHHCKACNAAICAKCSEFMPFPDASRQSRVCKDCFASPVGVPPSPGPDVTVEQQKKLLEKQVSLAAENCLVCGHLQFMEGKGKNWSRVWVTITKNEPLVMYLQWSNQESRGPRPVPLPGLKIGVSTEKHEVKNVFRLSHPHQTLLFSADDEAAQMRWMEILSKLTKGEIEEEAPVDGAEAMINL
ncbi:faciogenital dysplasia isoform X1 [Polypterus senegalus]|uniref:faciogenital dysplasia isoform X1 n=1 Tax=Polypterus senegalus TaxID=55291 RepID=UPI0019634DA1|nr:faciogenital dysplasia isoform X1 [Polypterus senegalus]